MSQRGRNFCVTIRQEVNENGPPGFEERKHAIQFLCVGAREQGADALERKLDDGWHQHAYLECTRAQRWSFVKGLFDEPGCHIEPARGNAEQAQAYCNKEGNTFTYGSPRVRNPGRRGDLLDAIEYLQRPEARVSELDFDMPGVAARHGRWAQRIFSSVLRSRARVQREVSVRLYWGPTGTGKSYRAFREGAGEAGGFYVVPIQSGRTFWLDGYEGESCVIFDDFDGQIPLRVMLRLLDGYQVTAPVKGGFTYPVWTTVIITSNLPYNEWYDGAGIEQLRALHRRLETGGIERMGVRYVADE